MAPRHPTKGGEGPEAKPGGGPGAGPRAPGRAAGPALAHRGHIGFPLAGSHGALRSPVPLGGSLLLRAVAAKRGEAEGAPAAGSLLGGARRRPRPTGPHARRGRQTHLSRRMVPARAGSGRAERRAGSGRAGPGPSPHKGPRRRGRTARKGRPQPRAGPAGSPRPAAGHPGRGGRGARRPLPAQAVARSPPRPAAPDLPGRRRASKRVGGWVGARRRRWRGAGAGQGGSAARAGGLRWAPPASRRGRSRPCAQRGPRRAGHLNARRGAASPPARTRGPAHSAGGRRPAGAGSAGGRGGAPPAAGGPCGSGAGRRGARDAATGPGADGAGRGRAGPPRY